jgi:hypothetical protein
MAGQGLAKLGTGSRYIHRGTGDEGRSNMAWTWRYHEADGAQTKAEELPAESFTSRGDAESWLGENWAELAEGGVGDVALLEEGREVYTMPLAAE